MKAHHALSMILLLGFCGLAPSQTQVPPPESVSSDDISVADGLQLPTYGHLWVLDSWKGLHELVRLRPPDTADEPGFSLKMHRNVEFKGEAAKVRLHDVAPTLFLRGVSGNGGGRSDLVAVRLMVEGQRRAAPRDIQSQLKQWAARQSTQAETQSPAIVAIRQQRVGTTDWYRLSLQQALAPGEYALMPLPGAPGFAEGEIFDFAIDPDAPENADPLRSEQYRGAP